jgi:hypothetical protein
MLKQLQRHGFRFCAYKISPEIRFPIAGAHIAHDAMKIAEIIYAKNYDHRPEPEVFGHKCFIETPQVIQHIPQKFTGFNSVYSTPGAPHLAAGFPNGRSSPVERLDVGQIRAQHEPEEAAALRLRNIRKPLKTAQNFRRRTYYAFETDLLLKRENSPQRRSIPS